MSSEYQHVSKSKLKLKNESDIKISKKRSKKQKKKDMEKQIRAVMQEPPRTNNEPPTPPPASKGRVLTKAEESFKKMQEKMQNKRIVEKAQMTHKQRVEQFNQHLDSLTEHFDIPKVSWTK
ncbi:AGAP000425-PA-like protein [Anopheles sinensis]|uniref:AGAP000425-PA-like protein n=1 Tax=Anopheles sinensis TaxID=74873 RepID=A0A084WSP6_ANOSI|nr:AGAP000425-PA-like protein [Anopheles sinensis]